MDLSTMDRQQLRDLINTATYYLAGMGETVTVTYRPHLTTWSIFDDLPTNADINHGQQTSQKP